MSDLAGYSTVQEAAGFLGVSRCWVGQLLCRPQFDGNPRLRGVRVGRHWLIPNKILAEFKSNPPQVQWRPRPAGQKPLVRLTKWVHNGPCVVGGLRGTRCGRFVRPTLRMTHDWAKVTCKNCLGRKA